MKYFKFGLYSVALKPLFNIIIMVEIAAVLIVVNMTISTANSRAVLNEPYEQFMNSEGYIFQPKGNLNTPGTLKEITVPQLMDSLQGDISVSYNYLSQIKTDKSVLKGNLLDYDTYRNVYVFDDKIFSKFRLPLSDGRWASSHRNEKNQIEAVVAAGTDDYLKVGDVIKAECPVSDGENNAVMEDIGEIVIVGIINNDYFFPDKQIQGLQKNISVRNLYQSNEEYRKNQSPAVFLVSSLADERFACPENLHYCAVFITYHSEPTEEIWAYNRSKLSSVKGQVIDLSTFKENSDRFLNEQYIKLFPIILCVFVIVLAGLTCSVSMNTYTQLRNYGVYFLCGCRWKGCLKISLAYSAIILTGGAILGTIAFLLFQLSDYSKLFVQNLALNNIYSSLAVILIMFIISLIIPFFMVRRTSPVRTIHAN